MERVEGDLDPLARAGQEYVEALAAMIGGIYQRRSCKCAIYWSSWPRYERLIAFCKIGEPGVPERFGYFITENNCLLLV